MKLKAMIKTDVLVMGAGLAGNIAAITAAEAGARVCLLSSTNLCSGSSFYPGTWGLGLIGPEDEEDKKDLEETILRIGEGMADPGLVHTLVEQIPDGIRYLESLGLHLKKAKQKGEKEFIPCFDHKNREWNGLLQKEAKEVFTKKVKELGILCMPDTEVIRAVMGDGRIMGVIALTKDGKPCYLACKALIIASGGMGGLFRYRLNTDDILGMGQYLALDCGAKLMNVEFMQMMPGFIRPAPKTIYNEKVFRHSCFCYPGTENSIFGDWAKEKTEELLKIRSTHGPFTSRLPSCEIDRRLFEVFAGDDRGVTLTYKEDLRSHQPEFVRTYFEWLAKEKNLTIDDPVQLGIYAHASNGGILIDGHGKTGVSGLYACGEAAGGMHGADRLGGLSTANGLVFGRLAGASAAMGAGEVGEVSGETEDCLEVTENADQFLEEIREINFRYAMADRSKEGCKEGLEQIGRMKDKIRTCPLKQREESSFRQIRDSYRLKAALSLSQCLLEAVQLRTESRGSHYRRDCPGKDENQSSRIICSLNPEIDVFFQH